MFLSFWSILLFSFFIVLIFFILFFSKYLNNNSERAGRIISIASILSIYNSLIISIIIAISFPTFTIINKDLNHSKRYYIGVTGKYKFYGKYIYNKTNVPLDYNKIIYGSKSNVKPEYYSISPNSIIKVKSLPDYYFETPPRSIRVKHGGSVERWLIH